MIVSKDISYTELEEKFRQYAKLKKMKQYLGPHIWMVEVAYIYNDYAVLKLNTLEGNKDLYIGVPSMYIDNVKKLN